MYVKCFDKREIEAETLFFLYQVINIKRNTFLMTRLLVNVILQKYFSDSALFFHTKTVQELLQSIPEGEEQIIISGLIKTWSDEEPGATVRTPPPMKEQVDGETIEIEILQTTEKNPPTPKIFINKVEEDFNVEFSSSSSQLLTPTLTRKGDQERLCQLSFYFINLKLTLLKTRRGLWRPCQLSFNSIKKLTLLCLFEGESGPSYGLCRYSSIKSNTSRTSELSAASTMTTTLCTADPAEVMRELF